MKPEEKNIGRAKLLDIVREAAAVAAKSFNLNIWGIELLGSGTRPVVRIFVDTPWENKSIPFIKPLTREEKSRQKSVHPMARQKIKKKPKKIFPKNPVSILTTALKFPVLWDSAWKLRTFLPTHGFWKFHLRVLNGRFLK